jgi:acetyl/propionyl-CoA carboxylase alpha subunit
MRRALDEFVVLGTTTNRQFLRELCDIDAVVQATTTTTTIDEQWPNGWKPTLDQEHIQAGLLLAETAEQLGWSTKAVYFGEGEVILSPFQTISRRLPR